MRLGVHVSIAGGLLGAVGRAEKLSCTTMQIFSRSPRGGPAPRFSSEEARRFDAQRRRAGMTPLAVHSPYIMNLASPEPQMWSRSVAVFQEEYRRAAQLKADYLVTHVGSHKGLGEAVGIDRVSEAINRTLAGVRLTVMILLENAAGSGQGFGYQFEQLAAIRNAVNVKAYVGFCLDTAHLFAAGFPIHTENGLRETVVLFDRTIGLQHLKLIHLNDSKAPFDSRVDRHWHIGQGHIGMDGMRRIVNHPQLKQIPLILETPKKTDREDRRNLTTVRHLAQQGWETRRDRRSVLAKRRTRTVSA